MIDQLEEKYGFKVENLNSAEKATFFEMLDSVTKSVMTPEKLRDYVVAMRDAVEREMVKEPTFIRIFIFKFENPKLIRLQARLQNYMLLESFLISPERAKKAYDEAVARIRERVK